MPAQLIITFNGKTQSLTQWSDELGIKRNVISQRLHRGWSIDEALSTPQIRYDNNEINQILTKEFLYIEYSVNRKSIVSIAKEIHISEDTIRQKIKEYDIPRRRYGLSHTRIYGIWWGMLSRCLDVKNTVYKYYGGRGITVCNEWILDFKIFYDWAINNGYKEDLEIDRIDTNGHYEPQNCRWVTHSENLKNRRKFKRPKQQKKITYNGITKSMEEWAKELDITPQAIYKRLLRGWSIKDALKTPKVF